MQDLTYEYKPLSMAQRNHLAALNAERQRIEAEIQRFVAYLAVEHDAPGSEGWSQIDAERGFVRQIPATDRDELPIAG
jgi:hypothetical protein